MDAGTLRTILIVFGALFLVGMYAWERRRAQSQVEEPLEDDGSYEDKLEPQLGAWGNGDDDVSGVAGAAAGEWGGASAAPEQSELEPQAPASTGPSAARGGPRAPLILVLYVHPGEGMFDGEAILEAADQCGIQAGEGDVFYRYSAPEFQRGKLFTVANMKNPGTFGLDDMASFKSPGLVLITEAEGDSDDPARLEEMLAVAHCLAAALDGRLLDGDMDSLTSEAEESMREQVLELSTSRLSYSD